MRYAYKDLGEQPEGTVVVFRLEGSAANVMLMNEHNFEHYRAGLPCAFVGGHQRRSPVRLSVPASGHWFAVLDTGGFRGRVKGTVQVENSGERRLEDAVAAG